MKSCSHSLPKNIYSLLIPFPFFVGFRPLVQIQQEQIQLQCVTMTMALAKSTILTLYRKSSNLNTLCGHSQNCVSNTFHLWAIHDTNANITTIIYHNYTPINIPINPATWILPHGSTIIIIIFTAVNVVPIIITTSIIILYQPQRKRVSCQEEQRRQAARPGSCSSSNGTSAPPDPDRRHTCRSMAGQ